MACLSMWFLGEFRVCLDGEPVAALQYDKVRAALAYLAVESGRPHRREVLAGLLWPELSEQRARRNLSQVLYVLHSALDAAGPPCLLVTSQTVQFDASCDHWLDVRTYTSLLSACKAHAHWRLETCPACAERLEEAVSLYAGPFLHGLSLGDSPAFEEWQLVWREQLHQLAVDALGSLAAGYEARGDVEHALRAARRWVELDPWHEAAHRQVMRALALSGRRNAALAQYEACRQTLAEELGVEPAAATRTLYECIRDGKDLTGFANLSGLGAPFPHNLPAAATPFVGRVEVLAQLTALLRDPSCRLVTLVGPGGIGKTRLALQLTVDVVMQAPVDRFPDGVYFVPLAPVYTVDGVVSAIVQAIGLSGYTGVEPRRQLLGYLRDKRMLLVLDNVEQLIDLPLGEGNGDHRGEGVELFLEMLRVAPEVQLLLTSRTRLNVSGEQMLAVPGMDCPTEDLTGRRWESSRWESSRWESGGKPVRSALEYSGVQLYLQQARRVRPGYEPSEEALAQIGRICRLVGGMPLAIVLAAAWMDVLSPGQIADELGKSIAFLRSDLRDLPERHRSMVAAFDVSWGMLSEAEQDAFAALSVFRGGCTREAAEAVAGADLEVLRALTRKSFLTCDEHGRYQVHELLRQYAENRLQQRAEQWERVRDRHCSYFSEYLAQHKDVFRKLGPGEARLEVDNVGAAWHWMLDRSKLGECRRAIGGFHWFDEGPAWYSLRRPLLEETVAMLRCAEPSRENRIALGMALCYLARSFPKEAERAAALVREGHRILTELDARRELAEAKMFVFLDGMEEDETHIDRLLQEALSLARETAAPMDEAWALFILGLRDFVRAMVGGEAEGAAWQRAQEAYSKVHEIYRLIGHRRGKAIVLGGQAQCAHAEGQYARAKSLREQSLALFRELDVRTWILGTLRGSGNAALTDGDYAEAQAYFLEDLEKARTWGNPVEVQYALCGLGDVALARGELGGAVPFYRRAVQGAIEVGGISGVERIALSMAKLSAQRGEPVHAAELLALAYHIVATHASYSWSEVGLAGGRELECALQEQLSPEVYAAAQERGRARDMEGTLRELLGELEQDT
jgi:predicted ATPase/DNA-binding SARP family transcriptional activator